MHKVCDYAYPLSERTSSNLHILVWNNKDVLLLLFYLFIFSFSFQMNTCVIEFNIMDIFFFLFFVQCPSWLLA
jgi:hypothetical protein